MTRAERIEKEASALVAWCDEFVGTVLDNSGNSLTKSGEWQEVLGSRPAPRASACGPPVQQGNLSLRAARAQMCLSSRFPRHMYHLRVVEVNMTDKPREDAGEWKECLVHVRYRGGVERVLAFIAAVLNNMGTVRLYRPGEDPLEGWCSRCNKLAGPAHESGCPDDKNPDCAWYCGPRKEACPDTK